MIAVALESLLDPVREIAEAASQKILKIYETDFTVAQKRDRSPVTEADLVAHETICTGLKKLVPDLPILSEESSKVPYIERVTWPRYWLVDPLDGTKDFIKKNGEFTVNIALVEEHESVLGVVHVPVADTCYYASRDSDSFKAEAGAANATRLKTRTPNPKRLVVSGSRSHGAETLRQFVNNLPGEVELLSKGSSLKLCLVAEGQADIYARFGPTSEWDTAAAQCVVERAGGSVVDLDFNPIRYNEKEDILNPHFLVIGDTSFRWREFLPPIPRSAP